MDGVTAYFGGLPVFGPRGPAGPDGNPIGAIIPYMGLTAPNDYLICDGAVYNIADYPDLADHFETQLGSKNYFGGDGETTFAVPDTNDLFLRGYNPSAEERLCGEIGKRQEATQIPNFFITYANYLAMCGHNIDVKVENMDTHTADKGYSAIQASGSLAVSDNPSSFTARPVNMAVLYCIKAVTSVPAENIYSTEETMIGTWIDGSPVYRLVIPITTGTANAHTQYSLPSGTIVSELISNAGVIQDGNHFTTIPNVSNDAKYLTSLDFINNHPRIYLGAGSVYTNKKGYLILEYTKATD